MMEDVSRLTVRAEARRNPNEKNSRPAACLQVGFRLKFVWAAKQIRKKAWTFLWALVDRRTPSQAVPLGSADRGRFGLPDVDRADARGLEEGVGHQQLGGARGQHGVHPSVGLQVKEQNSTVKDTKDRFPRPLKDRRPRKDWADWMGFAFVSGVKGPAAPATTTGREVLAKFKQNVSASEFVSA